MKKLIVILLLASCNVPYKVVTTTDSTGAKIVTKYYDNTVYNPPVYNPYPWGWYDPFWRGTRWYTPIIIKKK